MIPELVRRALTRAGRSIPERDRVDRIGYTADEMNLIQAEMNRRDVAKRREEPRATFETAPQASKPAPKAALKRTSKRVNLAGDALDALVDAALGREALSDVRTETEGSE